MNKQKILDELRKQYPRTNIVLNNQQNPTEIICEIDPSPKHPEYSIAIAVIDKSISHYHKQTTEEYEVIKGTLDLTANGEKIVLKTGDKFVIKPGVIHSAEGKKTWVKATSKPGWTFEDHVLVGDESKFAVSTYNKIADKYTQQYFNDLTDIPYIDKFLALLPKNAKLLDVGCGPGTFTKYLNKKGFDVEGVDLSQEMLKIAEEKIPRVEFKLMDMRKLDYQSVTFDGLLVAYSLIHIPSEEIPQTLRGFYRILKPRGLVMIIVQGGDSDKIVDEPLKKGEKIFINFFTKQRLSAFLDRAGFVIEYQEELPMKDPDSLSDKVIYTIARKN